MSNRSSYVRDGLLIDVLGGTEEVLVHDSDAFRMWDAGDLG
jgi:hypothetical protein